MNKPKVGIYGITGCMGCQLSILFQTELFEILDKIDLLACPGIKEKNQEDGFDIVFLEGTIVNKGDLKFVKHLRKKTKILVALGSCAADGCIPQMKGFANKRVEKSVYGSKTDYLKAVNPAPLDRHVKVDYYIRGCPSDKKETLKFIKDILMGKEFKTFEKVICHECNLQENNCLLEQEKVCLGPITFGDCSVMCPHYGFGCIGCRGAYTDSNFEKYFTILEEFGMDLDSSKKTVNKFAGLKIKEMIEKGIKEGKIDKKYKLG